MQSNPSAAAAAAAAVAALAVAVAKKRLTRMKGQLRSEETKWEWWENDLRTKVRYEALNSTVKEYTERYMMSAEDDDGLIQQLFDQNDALSKEVVQLVDKYQRSVAMNEQLAQLYKEERLATAQRAEGSRRHKELMVRCDTLLARNNKLKKAEGYEVFLENDCLRAQNRELREHILMREEDTDAAASGGGEEGMDRWTRC